MPQQDPHADWRTFAKAVPWFTSSKPSAARVEPRPARVLDEDAAARFPKFADLVRSASAATIAVDRAQYELLTWTNSDGARFGWLCLPPENSPSQTRLHESPQVLLKSLGGIAKRFNEPDDTWLLNLNDALTARLAADSDFDRYSAVLDGPVPIDVNAYYPIALEANGNVTLCHRDTGDVVLFAPDHSFDHVTVLDGCPEYTFYTIDGVTVLVDWIEAVARQWAKHIVLQP